MEGQHIGVRPEDSLAGTQLIRPQGVVRIGGCHEGYVLRLRVGLPVLVFADVDHLRDKHLDLPDPAVLHVNILV